MGCGDKNRPRERERGWKGGFSIWSWGFSKRLTVAEKRREIFFPRSFRQEQEYFVRIAYTLFSTSWTFRVCASINAKRSSTLIKEALAECEIKTLQGITACAAFLC